MSYGSVNYGFAGVGGLDRPAVVPRVRRGDGSSSLPIDRLILPMMRAEVCGLVVITAPGGGGKTTALRYLQLMLPAGDGVRLFDQQPEAARAAAGQTLAVLVDVGVDPDANALECLELSQWTLDDCIEYLAGRHRDQLARVLKLLSKDEWLPTLNGSPQLLALVMDAMAADPALRDSPDALRSYFGGLNLPAAVLSARLVECCLAGLPVAADIPEYAHLFRHQAVQHVWVAHFIANQLSLGDVPACLNGMATQHVLGEIAAAVLNRSAALQTLENLVAEHPAHDAVAMAASILLRILPDWRPEDGTALNFRQADLRSANWPGIDLGKAHLSKADLSHSTLQGCTIHFAPSANFTGADLRNAELFQADLQRAEFAGADLSHAIAKRCDLSHADCQQANFTAADFTGAKLSKTNLARATLHGTCLESIRMVRAIVDEASFDHVDLTRASLRAVRLNTATWNSPIFRRARLRRCNLEGLELPEADFTKADCTGSLFTGSRIARGIFVGANLQKTGLAEIEWDDADLRAADFTNASFHLGSSRSGLVGSTIPSEGSRTGFYTDDFTEQDFKTPEEIRKACLCGANLVGAVVEKTDFYLVDLRGAKYTKSQARHFRGCGAILVAKAR